jgi:signal transduction histidine kinase
LTPKEFLNTILHELRTPMTVIKGYVKILSKEEGQKYLPEALEAISSSVERINTLYEDMATYTRELMKNPDA